MLCVSESVTFPCMQLTHKEINPFQTADSPLPVNNRKSAQRITLSPCLSDNAAVHLPQTLPLHRRAMAHFYVFFSPCCWRIILSALGIRMLGQPAGKIGGELFQVSTTRGQQTCIDGIRLMSASVELTGPPPHHSRCAALYI